MPNSWKKNIETLSKKKKRGNGSKKEYRHYKITRKYSLSQSLPKRCKRHVGCNRGNQRVVL